MPSNDPAERANAIAYLALCEIRDIELDEEPEELRQARHYLCAQFRSDVALDPAPSSQPFDDFEAAPRDVQDRIVLEAVGAHRRTSMQINDAIAQDSPGCRCCGDETRKVLDRLVVARSQKARKHGAIRKPDTQRKLLHGLKKSAEPRKPRHDE